MSNRDHDALAAVIHDEYNKRPVDRYPTERALAAAIHAAGFRPPPRVIKSPEDLDALTVRSIILADGQAWQSYGTPDLWRWHLTGRLSGKTSAYVIEVSREIVVLWEPTQEQTR